MKIETLVPSESDFRRGYRRVGLGGSETVMASVDVDGWILAEASCEFDLIKGYEKKTIMHYDNMRMDMKDFLATHSLQQARMFNQKKCALASTLYPGMGRVLIGKTTYFSSILTNEACTRLMRRGEIGNFDFRKIFPWSREDLSLLSIETSGMSNHVGVSGLALSRDRYPVVWIQNQNAQHNINELMPTGSGSLDWSDVRSCGSCDIFDIFRFGIAREMREEGSLNLGSFSRSVADIAEKTLLIGYYRWTRRGGKPEFYGISYIDLPYKDFFPEIEEVDVARYRGGGLVSTNAILSEADLVRFCDGILTDPDIQVGVPLKMILRQLKRILNGEFGDEARGRVFDIWKIK
ncbi:MAG: hypothetical protein ACF8MJ_11960 [Phycisphaerales bacterium JB050]